MDNTPSPLERCVRAYLKHDDLSDEDIDRMVALLKSNALVWAGAEAEMWFAANGYIRQL